MNKVAYVYGLHEPGQPERIRYVGRTTQPHQRMLNHKNSARSGEDSPLYQWVRTLMESESSFEFRILEECTTDEWTEREKFWICHYRESGELLNGSPGGRRTGSGRKKMADEDKRDVVVQFKITRAELGKLEKRSVNRESRHKAAYRLMMDGLEEED